MERFTSPPIANPTRDGTPFSRADLVFYGVDHSGPSFEARIYFNDADVNVLTPRDTESFAGSFTIFGHSGCAGDEGHCEVPPARDVFDRRPPHALTPQTKTVIVTDAVRRAVGEELVFTVIAVRPGPDGAELVDALTFDRFSLLTFA